MEVIKRYLAYLRFSNRGREQVERGSSAWACRWGRRSPVLAVLPIVAGPALTHVAARGVGAVHAGCHVPAGVHVTRIHTPLPKVPCGDRPALPHPGTRLSHRRSAFREGVGGERPSA